MLERQPAHWDVEWWFCPSYYTDDPLLARVFGEFEPEFPETVRRYLPPTVACFWTGSKVVPESITLADMEDIGDRMGHRLLLWDNYPVNDLTMQDEMHIGPLTGRDPRLPERVHAHLANPLLQEELSFIPVGHLLRLCAGPFGLRSGEELGGGRGGTIRRGRPGALAVSQAIL